VSDTALVQMILVLVGRRVLFEVRKPELGHDLRRIFFCGFFDWTVVLPPKVRARTCRKIHARRDSTTFPLTPRYPRQPLNGTTVFSATTGCLAHTGGA
jgi:hypothetical protein